MLIIGFLCTKVATAATKKWLNQIEKEEEKRTEEKTEKKYTHQRQYQPVSAFMYVWEQQKSKQRTLTHTKTGIKENRAPRTPIRFYERVYLFIIHNITNMRTVHVNFRRQITLCYRLNLFLFYFYQLFFGCLLSNKNHRVQMFVLINTRYAGNNMWYEIICGAQHI